MMTMTTKWLKNLCKKHDVEEMSGQGNDKGNYGKWFSYYNLALKAI
jgi:hypothetical protein